MNPLDFTGKTVMITGASRGIGRATAVYLSRLGARIVAVARDQRNLEQTLSLLDGSGHCSFSVDLTDVESLPAWMKGAVQTSGMLYGLVHCAGVAPSRPLKVLGYKDLTGLERINLYAALMLSKGFLQPGVCEEEAGAIVYVSSVAALKGEPALGAYAATKGALVSAARTLAVELARRRVRVNCVCPGLVQTEMTAGLDRIMTPEEIDRLQRAYPLGIGVPDDVAYGIAFLLAPAARWITGAALVLDGGRTA